MNTFTAKTISSDLKNEKQFELLLGVEAYRAPLPLCTEQNEGDSKLLQFRVDARNGIPKTGGDLLKLAKTKGFQAKEVSNSIILQSEAVQGHKGLPLDNPCQTVSYQGNMKQFRASVLPSALLSCGLSVVFEKGMNETPCKIEFKKKGGNVRDFLAAFAAQNGWAWDVFYNASDHKGKIVSTDLEIKGTIRFYKRSPASPPH